MRTPKSIAAISGGLGDIGQAIGRKLQSEGYRVALGDLPTVAPECAQGFDAYTSVDVTNEKSVKNWFDSIHQNFGDTAKVVVVNAGIVLPGTALTTSAEDWKRTLDVNLTGGWLTAREGARRMLRAKVCGGASIIFIGSWVGQFPVPELPAYCASKAALRSLMQTLAQEVADTGIRVNEVAPGYVNAGLSGTIFRENPGLAEKAARATPTGNLVEADEVAAAVAWLADPYNRNLTGTTITLDGGLSLLHGPQGLQNHESL